MGAASILSSVHRVRGVGSTLGPLECRVSGSVSMAASKQRAKQVIRRTIGEPYVGKRLKQIRLGKELDRLDLKPARILEAGSEDATFVYWLADRYRQASVLAVDIDSDAISSCLAARPRPYSHRVDFQVRDFADLESSSFDLITAFDVLEHVADDVAAVRDLAVALRPGGTLLVHVPRNRWRAWNGEIHTLPDQEAWKIQPGHVRVGYSPDGLRSTLEQGGLEVVDVQVWLGRLGVAAHAIYGLLEHPALLRLLSVPVTVAAARIESRYPTPDGNAVFARATKSLSEGC
jgi:SAM-dependent methyltransferase